MNVSGDKIKIRQTLIYLVGIACIFLLGLGCGLTVSIWWEESPNEAAVVFVTASPDPAQSDLTGTTRPGDLIPPTPCSITPPSGWELYTILTGDTLSDLATERRVSLDQLKQVNCLLSEDIVEGERLYLPTFPTPTPGILSPPVWWERYFVQSGNTLFALATARGTTIAEIMRVNCLSSEIIGVGDPIYLPALPTPTPVPLPSPTLVPTIAPSTPIPTLSIPTPAPTVSASTPAPIVSIPTLPTVPVLPTTAPTDEACSPLSCNGSLAPYPYTPSDPGGEDELGEILDYEPCEDIDESSGDNGFDVQEPFIELGSRRYIFACGDLVKPLTVTITRPNNGLIQHVEALDTLPNRALQSNDSVAAVIDWPVLPFYPIGDYTVSLTDSVGTMLKPLTLIIIPPENPHVLVVPSAGPPGTEFLVYFTNFTTTETLTFEVYGGGEPWPDDEDDEITYEFPHRASLSVRIDEPLPGQGERGWGVKPLFSIESDRPAPYTIGYNGQVGIPYWLFWLE